jgi:hypothetical protein
MSGTWDADVTLVYAACGGGSFAVDTIKNGEAFDVVASIRIGRNLMQVVDNYDLFVSVRNLSQSSILLRQRQSRALAPQNAPLSQQLRVGVDAGWTANEGDILEVVATLKVTAGIHPDYSLTKSGPFIVST